MTTQSVDCCAHGLYMGNGCIPCAHAYGMRAARAVRSLAGRAEPILPPVSREALAREVAHAVADERARCLRIVLSGAVDTLTRKATDQRYLREKIAAEIEAGA